MHPTTSTEPRLYFSRAFIARHWPMFRESYPSATTEDAFIRAVVRGEVRYCGAILTLTAEIPTT